MIKQSKTIGGVDLRTLKNASFTSCNSNTISEKHKNFGNDMIKVYCVN